MYIFSPSIELRTDPDLPFRAGSMATGRWHILGGGSLGSLWSARLARAGNVINSYRTSMGERAARLALGGLSFRLGFDL